MIDINFVNRMIRSIKQVETPIRRGNAINLRIYSLSKMLPDKEGRELIALHEEGKRKAIEAYSGYRRAMDEE